jgi:uncharacterized protein
MKIKHASRIAIAAALMFSTVAPAFAAPGKGFMDIPQRRTAPVTAMERIATTPAPTPARPRTEPTSITRLPGGTVTVAPVRSFAAMRFDRVVRQSFDLSCGAAALATLMEHYWGRDDMSERQIIDAVIAAAPESEKDQIANAGFSMLELKRHAEREGFIAGGFRLTDVNQIASLRAPAITLINSRGYAHFVVIKGVANGRVFIADPAFGNRAVPLQQFGREWNQTILVIVDPNAQGDPTFRMDPTRRTRTDTQQAAFDYNLQGRDTLTNMFSGQYTTLSGVQFSSFGEY